MQNNHIQNLNLLGALLKITLDEKQGRYEKEVFSDFLNEMEQGGTLS